MKEVKKIFFIFFFFCFVFLLFRPYSFFQTNDYISKHIIYSVDLIVIYLRFLLTSKERQLDSWKRKKKTTELWSKIWARFRPSLSSVRDKRFRNDYIRLLTERWMLQISFSKMRSSFYRFLLIALLQLHTALTKVIPFAFYSFILFFVFKSFHFQLDN